MTDSPRILIIGPSWVGDMVMAQSLAMVLKARRPGAFIGVLAPAWTEPLLARMPEVDIALPAAFSHGRLGLKERLKQARTLRQHGFDQAIVLPRSIKSALAPWLARIPRRTGYLGEMRYGLLNDIHKLDKEQLPFTVQRFVHLADAGSAGSWPAPKLKVEKGAIPALLEKLGLQSPERPFVAFCPGAEYGPAKRWPARHFAALANRLMADGIPVWLFGSDKDRDEAAAIQAEVDQPCVDLTGRTRLGEAIDLMSLAGAVVSNDSGLMHVAAALGRPLVSIYGSSSPKMTPPLSEDAAVCTLDLDCSPCFKRTCPLGHLHCLEQLEPSVIEAEVRRRLGNTP